MKWKLSDAKNCLRKERFNNTSGWRKYKAVISDAGILRNYDRVWNLEWRRVIRGLKMKRKKKVIHLKEKYGRKRRVPDKLEGITIADGEVPVTFSSEPECYGGCSTDEKERKVLSLPPKFAVYDRVNTDECEAEIEKGLAKLRWTKRKQFEKDDPNKHQNGENQVTDGERERTIYNIKSKTFDFRNMRATDLPFNKRVHLPDPLDDESEIAIQNLKTKLNQITEEYVKGEKVRKWSNLEKDEREGLVSLKKKVEAQENVVFQTDKSGRFSINSLENYKTASQPHISDSVAITKGEHDRLQQLINAHPVS